MRAIAHIIAVASILFTCAFSACAFSHPEVLASTEWLQAHLDDPSVRVVDGRRPPAFYGGQGREGYQAGHIPGAVFLDIREGLSDPQSSVPLMIPPPDSFADLMGRLGIDENTTVVMYDQSGGMWVARLWWALRYHGHDAAMILDGGLTKWNLEDRPLETGDITPAPATFTAQVRPGLRSTVEDVEAAIGNPDVRIINALPAELHLAGHIPSARNLPAPANIDPASHAMLPADELAELWRGVGLKPDQLAITYCGGGYYGAFDLFVLYLLGHERASLYDGSWIEWTANPERPVETDPTAVEPTNWGRLKSLSH